MAAMIAVACVLELALFAAGRLPGIGMAVAGFMLGTVAMTIYSVASAHANDRSDAGHAVTIASGLLFLYSGRRDRRPLTAAAMMERLGPQALFCSWPSSTRACWPWPYYASAPGRLRSAARRRRRCRQRADEVQAAFFAAPITGFSSPLA